MVYVRVTTKGPSAAQKLNVDGSKSSTKLTVKSAAAVVQLSVAVAPVKAKNAVIFVTPAGKALVQVKPVTPAGQVITGGSVSAS